MSVTKQRLRAAAFSRTRFEGVLGTFLSPTSNDRNVENDRPSKSRISLCAIVPLNLALNLDGSYGVRCLRCFTIEQK